MLRITTPVKICYLLITLALFGCVGDSADFNPVNKTPLNNQEPDKENSGDNNDDSDDDDDDSDGIEVLLSDIRINPINNFEFKQDTDNRADKVVGAFEFTLTDIANKQFIRDLDNSNMSFQERGYGSESAYITEVEATQSSAIDITSIDVVYLIDNSYSVVESAAGDELITQANLLASKVNQQNISAGDTSNTIQYRLFADSVSELRNASAEQPFNDIEFEAQGGGTALYEGIQLSLMDLTTSAQPALFVFTDGRENASSPGYNLDLILSTAQQYNIPIYIVGLGEVDSAVLNQIATTSGGDFFRASSVEQLSEVFDSILGSIPVTYSVTYKPTQRTGHIEFKFVVDYGGASDSVTADFNVDQILGN